MLALADKFYSTHQLSVADAYRITCKVPKVFTCVPIPMGGSTNYAGLFFVDLPPSVSAGQVYTILVRRISTKPGALPPPPPPPPIQGQKPQTSGAQAAVASQPQIMRNWR